MKVVKPLRLSVLSRPFALQPGQQRLGVTVMAMTGMAPGQPMLYPDVELWPLVAEEIGAQGVLDLGMPKRSAEFLATGHAYTAHQETPRNRCVARVRVGELEKTLRVSGDRYWLDGRATDPLPFESMPLDWSRAFGGPSFADNPLGIGAEDETVRGVRTRRLPNVELPGSPMHRPDQSVRPASFSALDVMWPERFARIGKAYDAQWVAEGFPGYARDMDWHLFNAAPQDQWWHGADHIPDAAPYAIWNMHPTQACQRGQLPDWRARCFVTRTENDGEVFEEAPMRLSTAWFFPHRERIVLIYHGLLDIAEDDAADVRHLMPALEDAQAAPLPAEHYRGILRQRLDPETGALHTFRDRDLVPPAAIGPWFDNQSLRDRPIGPLARNATRGATLMREDMRERLIASGQDPDRYALPDESAQALPDLDALPEFVARSRLAQEEARQQLKAQQQLLAERLQANANAADAADATGSAGPEAPGADMQQLLALAQGRKTPGIKGPPSAAMTPGFQSMAAAVAAMPAHQAADMAPLADLMQRNATVDASLRKMYLHSAHHQDAADRMEAAPAARLREQVAGRMAASRDFSGMDLTGADLSGMDLRGARFTGAQLESANLDGAQLDDADLSQAVLVRASLHAASLRRACLDGANLGLAQCSRTVFAGASLRGTTLEQMHCEDCDFDDTQWEDNTLLEVHIARCSFRRASLKVVMLFEKTQLHTLDFSHAQLFKLTLVGCKPAALRFAEARCEACVFVDVQADGPLDFSGATLRTTCFVGRTSLRQAVFRGAHLRECSLRLMALAEADLSGSRLENCDFSECDLSRADLSRTDARESRFVRAVLQHASLRDANLIDASLQKADLRFADLRGANLFRADLSQSLVDDSTLLEGAYTRLAKVVPARREGAAVP